LKTYYDILEINQSASIEVIQAAYRALSKKYHPDLNRSPDALQKMQEINNAKDILSDEELRREYDRSISNNFHNQQQPKTDYGFQNDTGFNPNTSHKLKYKTVIVNGCEVNFKYCYHDYSLYVNFWSKDTEVFNKVKDIVKRECYSRWNPDTKFWKCNDPYYYNLLNRFKLDSIV
jgi:curved DNA-binding protein CbpA